jgi:hypothetical protein
MGAILSPSDRRAAHDAAKQNLAVLTMACLPQPAGHRAKQSLAPISASAAECPIVGVMVSPTRSAAARAGFRRE